MTLELFVRYDREMPSPGAIMSVVTSAVQPWLSRAWRDVAVAVAVADIHPC